MPYKVKNAFFDKTDNMKPYSKGSSYSHDDEERIAFLIEKGFLEPKSKPPDETPSVPDELEIFRELKADEQRDMLARLGIEGDDSNEEKRVALYTAYLEEVGE